jgi:hypothetical protein
LKIAFICLVRPPTPAYLYDLAAEAHYSKLVKYDTEDKQLSRSDRHNVNAEDTHVTWRFFSSCSCVSVESTGNPRATETVTVLLLAY